MLRSDRRPHDAKFSPQSAGKVAKFTSQTVLFSNRSDKIDMPNATMLKYDFPTSADDSVSRRGDERGDEKGLRPFSFAVSARPVRRTPRPLN
jgi:hypothetical protein